MDIFFGDWKIRYSRVDCATNHFDTYTPLLTFLSNFKHGNRKITVNVTTYLLIQYIIESLKFFKAIAFPKLLSRFDNYIEGCYKL